MTTSVTAVVLAYGSEPWLVPCVDALLASEDIHVDVVIVDNGCTDDGVERLRGRPGTTIVTPGRNLGFAGGCNEGATRATGDVVAFVNGDAIVEPSAIARLAAAALPVDVGIATASLRLADDPSRLNSAGNEVHFLGFSWSGHFGERAADHDVDRDATGATGACMALRREVWEDLGGFDPEYFAYHEDAELSLRCWQRGLRVRFVSAAVATHRYEFGRNPLKFYLVERNRLMFVLTLFERRTILLLLPALVITDLGVAVMAAAGGWLPQKVRGWSWLVRNRRWVCARRRRLQAERTTADRVLAARLSARIDPANFPLPSILAVLNWVLRAYWGCARRLL